MLRSLPIRSFRLALVLVGLFALARPADAAITVKMATLAPEGSTWYKALRKMGDDWTRITNGEVQVKIYAGGVAGNETVMLRKMRIGQLHAGAITTIGLVDIDNASMVSQTPMLFEGYEELDYVMERLSPAFEKRLADKGFVVLNWSDAGWARYFSKTPMTVPDQTSNFKAFIWEGDPAAVELYRKMGFKPVVIAVTDMMPALQSGMVDAYAQTPLATLAMQWFALTPHMLEVPWAPLLCATIISQETWDRIPAQYHDALLASARDSGNALKAEIRRQDDKAIEVMKRYGLKVHTVDSATHAQWAQTAQSLHPIIREKMVPPEIFDQANSLVEEYRSGQR
ncbi:MAG: TRAP transporter substrate-binding protein DctP [Myxococcota bacterium]|jgi:TRAP-type C4-dicarboxylate transport system substrate-binding protein|nr:TRAP transporter substrate-binding protein DctP [Myxococcota bacterium]